LGYKAVFSISDDFYKSKSSPENNLYFYHSDHLGSSSMITDYGGNLVQHIEYIPFGEVFVEERNNNWNTPYKFNGKEMDEETGLYYYGARYYDPRTSVWLSVDPLAQKYPNVSSYVYCHNNPINMIDPDGMTDYEVTESGNMYKKFPVLDAIKKFFGHKDKNDRIIAVDRGNKTSELPEGSIGEITKLEKGKGEYFNISDDAAAEKAYNFLSENTVVEWGITEADKSSKSVNILSTSHNSTTESLEPRIESQLLESGWNVKQVTHSHLTGEGPSGYHSWDKDEKYTDQKTAKHMNDNYPKNKVVNRVYDVKNGKVIYYNSSKIYKNVKK